MNYNDLPVHSEWVFLDESMEKAQIENKQTYEIIKDLAVIECVGSGYGHTEYRVKENRYNLDLEHLALIADKGNLCFGYRGNEKIVIIHTD